MFCFDLIPQMLCKLVSFISSLCRFYVYHESLRHNYCKVENYFEQALGIY